MRREPASISPAGLACLRPFCGERDPEGLLCRLARKLWDATISTETTRSFPSMPSRQLCKHGMMSSSPCSNRHRYRRLPKLQQQSTDRQRPACSFHIDVLFRLSNFTLLFLRDLRPPTDRPQPLIVHLRDDLERRIPLPLHLFQCEFLWRRLDP